MEAIKRRLKSGIGITVLPEIAVRDDIAQKKLIVLPWTEGKTDVDLLMI